MTPTDASPTPEAPVPVFPDPEHAVHRMPPRINRSALFASALVFLLACSDGTTPVLPDPVEPDPPREPGDPANPDPPGDLRLVEVASGLDAPVALVSPPGEPRLFVVEQRGVIRIIEDGVVAATPFLDIRDRVLKQGEMGLLGLAFHPGFAANRSFYVNFNDASGATNIVRFRARADDPARADPTTGTVILSVPQPGGNHNGGQLSFGPDGMLWIGMGDGGSPGDADNEGQDSSSLLGAMLRIDVDTGTPYGIPADNPFVSGGGRPEVWALGLRNPWRWSFDRTAGLLYLADVGQSVWEEINVAPVSEAGINYGWRLMEGPDCFVPATGCARAGLHLPVLSYRHDQGCSVTGGFVYRGEDIPALVGRYLYGDFCAGWIRSFRLQGSQATDARELFTGVGNILSFGEDHRGELYVLTGTGRVLRIEG